MVFIKTVPVEDALGDVRRMYQLNQSRLGYVPNYAKAFSLRPALMEARGALNKSLRTTMDLRRYELVTLAAARALRSSYCSLAHGRVLEEFFTDTELARVATGSNRAPLSEVDVAVMSFAEKVVRQADAITEADVRKLRDLGLDDGEVFDVAATAAARCFFSKTLDAVGTEPDASYGAFGDELRQALTVGRPISEEAVERIETG